ncbi:MAG: polysaccharide deacetylase family protein [Clostridia bacterium]
MFLVFNKDKIMSYVVTLFTIVVLFLTASAFSTEKAVTTSTNSSKLLPIYSVDTNEPKVAITINCAWSADDIDMILETLKNQEVKVTFFMVGDWVEKNEEAVKKIYEAGHEIGNHSYSHPHVNNISLDKNKEQIQKCSDLIKNITGEGTKLYRGPYGEYNDTVIQAAQELQHQTIQWSIDTLDYKGLTR